MRMIGSLEARMGSTRLPGKTLMPLYQDMTLLEGVVNRFKLCKEIEDVVVATTVTPKDDPIADWCENHRVHVYRGSEENVLDRVVGAARSLRADAIAQMGADSAYLDFELLDVLIGIFKSGTYDYVSNDLTLTYPLGIYGHIVSVPTLEALNRRKDLSDQDRVDVVRRIFEHPSEFKIKNIEASAEFRQPQLRFTIDYPEDMDQARAIYAHFKGYHFTTRQLLALSKQQPSLFEKTLNLVQQSAPHLSPKK